MNPPVAVIDLGLMPYKPAWDKQLEVHAQVLDGTLPAGALILVEHPPVITIGRRPGAEQHLLAGRALLEARGVEVIETDRGGDITFHGPGQLVAYPILNLNTYHLNLHSYMRFLEEVVMDTLSQSGVTGERSDGATGVWVKSGACTAKVCAMGVKLRRWVTFHGLALNITTDLSYFDLINPCGLSRPVTSLKNILGDSTPPMSSVKHTLARCFQSRLAAIAAKTKAADSSETPAAT